MKCMLLALALVSPALLNAQWRITQHYPVGGEGRWDYVVPDPANHRLFIGREDRVMVVDENDGRLLGEVKGIHGAHGTAIDPASGHGFATSGDDSSIVMFDLGSYAVLGRAHAAEDADAIIFDEPSRHVISFNGDAHSATVVEPERGSFVANIDLGGKPEYGVSAGDGMVYVNLTDTSEVVEIDAKTLRVTRRWSTAPCRQPVAMAIDRVHRRLFSGCRSGVMAVSDIASGRVIATVPIGAGTDGAAFDPASGDAFASNADGTLTVIHEDAPDAYHVAQTITTAAGSRNMGLDPRTHRAFVVAAKFGPAPAQATTANPRRRPAMVPGTFEVMVAERSAAAGADDNPPVVGRWDITITGSEQPMPSWLEIVPSGNGYLVGRFVGVVGSARPISRVEYTNGVIHFAIPPQWEQGTGDLMVEGRLQGETLTGSMTFPDGNQMSWTGTRAPSLRRTAAPRWGPWVTLLKNNSMSGWHALGTNQWQVTDGVLRSPQSGANIVTDSTFNDYQLHIEFRYPKGSNSGVYQRGRYEVQIEDSVTADTQDDLLGAVYGFISPSDVMAKKPGVWQSFDITLLGRSITVVANGKTVICNREVPGITGGALDSNEGEPGPLLLQGDHGPIEYRNIRIRRVLAPH